MIQLRTSIRSAVYAFILLLLTHSFAFAAEIKNDNDSSLSFLNESEKLWMSAHPTISIAFDSNYPPYSFKNESGEFVGIAVDITRLLEKRLGVNFKIYPHGQWQHLYSAAQHGQVDVIATLVKRPGREEWFEFTRPYLSLTQYTITREELVNTLRTKQHLNHRRIALISGYSTSDLANSELTGITSLYVPSLAEALEQVSIGQADAAIGDIGMAHHLISKMGLINLRLAFPYTKTAAKQRFGVRKDWPQLATILDKTLESIDYPELISIYARWNMPDILEPEAGFLSVADKLTEQEKAWLDKHPKIRLASDYAWPPFESISEQGVYSGIAADYMAVIEEKLGIEFVTSPRQPWDDVLNLFKNKQLDVLTCAMETTSRREFASFTSPYISHPMVIVTRDDVGFIDGLNGLKNKTIAIEQSYASFDILSRDHPELKLVPFSNSLSAMQAVSTGEVFSYIGNVATLSHVVREHGITNIKVSGQAPYSFALSIGVRDDWPELTAIIQKTLDSISIEQRNEILQKWIAVKIDKPFNYTLLWQVSAAVAIVILMIIYWNLTLNKKVSERTAELEFHAHFDTVTHLPNRVLVLDRLQKLIETSQRNNKKAAILFLDLDDFKKINDSLGHDTGDLLLIEIAKRIKNNIRSIDTVGRLGGDEFILLIEDLSNDQKIATVTNKVLNCFQAPFIINDRELVLTISIGIAIYPDNGTTTSELLRNSDIAMYHAKREGKNTFSFFTQSMSQTVARQLLLEEHMHTAMAAQEFEAYFQPKVTLDTKELIGFEALLRWNSKALGSISPVEFIPVAENNGQIIQLGDFVLEEAIKACKSWQDQFNKPFVISVNLSPRQFRDREALNKISSLLNKYQLAHNCLELEITEGVLINEYTDAKTTLKEIHSLGIQLAMDDFGTGYSSLSYLRNYPFNTLKIDREFINDITDNDSDKTLAIATIAMAQGLGLNVVAEGVETEEQFKLLSTLKCDYAQGYLISKPIPLSEATEFISRYLD